MFQSGNDIVLKGIHLSVMLCVLLCNSGLREWFSLTTSWYPMFFYSWKGVKIKILIYGKNTKIMISLPLLWSLWNHSTCSWLYLLWNQASLILFRTLLFEYCIYNTYGRYRYLTEWRPSDESMTITTVYSRLHPF